MTSPRRTRAWLATGLRLAGSVLILALLFHFLNFTRLWATMRTLPLGLWLLVLGGYLATHVIGAFKWRLTVNVAGAGLTFAEAVRCYYGGLFGALFLPSVVGGDVVRLGLALRLAPNRHGALLGSIVDRILDFTALGILALVGVLLSPGALDPRSRRAFRWVAAGVVAAAIIVLAVLSLIPARRFSIRLRRHLVRLRQAARSMSRRRGYVLLSLALGVVVQGSLVLFTAVIAGGCGLHEPLRVWVFAFPLAKLAALLPVSQGGIGVREVALAALVVPFGVAPELAVAVGLVWETIIAAGGLAGGLVSFLLGRRARAARGVAA